MRDKLYQAAQKGFLGHSALLDPQAAVEQYAPQAASLPDIGSLVAQNAATNEFGFADRMKADISLTDAEKAAGMGRGAPSQPTSAPVRSKAQADLNERLLQQGYSAAAIKAMEQNK